MMVQLQQTVHGFGIGIDEISGLADPSSYRGNYGTKEGLQYNVEKNVKALYPKITFNGKNYTYAETGSENSYKRRLLYFRSISSCCEQWCKCRK